MAKIAGQPLDLGFLRYLPEREFDEVTIVVSPAFDGGGRLRQGFFEARLLGHSEIICVSSQALLDCSRLFLSAGFKPTAVIKKVRHDSPRLVSMSARIAIAARYDVMGDRFVRRQKTHSMSGPTGAADLLRQSGELPDE